MDAARDYGQDQELIKSFLRDYTHVTEEGDVGNKYVQQMTSLANREATHMFVELADLELYNQDLANKVVNNTQRYAKIFYEALDELLPSYKTKDPALKDIMDIFIEQRMFVAERNQRTQSAPGNNPPPSMSQTANNIPQNRFVDVNDKYPPDLIRRAEVYFKPATLKATPIREVLSDKIGKLLTIRGIVTRVTDVKPKITIVTYTCDQCGCETFQPVGGNEFTPLFECTSATCKTNKALGRLIMQTRGSKFVKYQEIKLQEHSDQVPIGHIPRTITIHASGELTRTCTPGDHISVSGVFLPLDKQGFRMRTGGLASDVYIETHYITQMNKTEDDELNSEPLSMEDAVKLANGQDNFLAKLSSSIAPEIFGHDDLKKALLLLLVGGVDRSPHGMKIRGNINICLMGDPGVAKSQLLSFIDRLATRSQYTTGRGSSGVGLTAAVLKDPITNELVLEGGAMVLADKGICCIDEFDKMMDADRTAIHEVMEQQTVSIAKAGILTTLNARVSILAAANPAYGRYNVNRTVTDNLQLPPALLSRFDLLWLIRDRPDKSKDLDLASHITHIHMNPDEPINTDTDAIDMKIMRRYIALCKLKNPTVPKNLTEKLVQIYLDIRARKRSGSNEDSLFTSPRSLLAVIRLSTAFARLRLGESVEDLDVEAAVDLYTASRESIEGSRNSVPPQVQVLDMMRDMARQTKRFEFTRDEIIDEAISRKYTTEQIQRALEMLCEYEAIIDDGRRVVLTDQNFPEV